MPWVCFHQGPDTGSGFGSVGATTYFRPGDPVGLSIPQLSDIVILAARGSAALYEGRLYVCGQYTDNVMTDEHMRLHRLGIDPPLFKPTLSSGGGGPISGMTGDHLGYVSFYDEITGERSSLSSSGALFANSGGNAVTWTNLPTTALNPRVTHIELWRSVDGGAIRFVGRRTLGVSTTTEQIPTLALGEVAPEAFERFPPCKINAIYHDRQYMAGNREAPDTLYASEIFFPERFGGLTFKTRNGEPIVGLVNVRDMLLVLCPESSYILQGYSEDDAVFSMSEPELGALGHHGIRLAHGNAIIPNSRSIYLFNGAWHNILKDGMDEWRRAVRAYPEAFEDGFGVFDNSEDVYKFGVYGVIVEGDNDTIPDFEFRGITPGTLYWVADMRPTTPQIEGTFNPPNWSFDYRQRQDLHATMCAVPGGTRPRCITASNDGTLREENIADEDGDDNDGYQKRIVINTKGYLMDAPGGDVENGKTLENFWTYVKSELVNWEMRVVGGDDESHLSLKIIDDFWNDLVFFRDFVDLSQQTVEITIGPDNYSGTLTPKTVHVHMVERVTGRAFFCQVTAALPVDFVFRGIGGTFGPGPATRTVAGYTISE